MAVPEQEGRIGAVVVARNEAATLGVCLGALRHALDEEGGGEILVVDSASTDLTAQIARESGCRVIRVTRASRLCPSAMRRIGASRMRCRYLLFLDGDCELEAGFLPLALRTIEADPTLGVVAGHRKDYYRTRLGLVPAAKEYYSVNTPRASPEVPAYGGSALYRRAALEEAGSFDPFLRAKEEEELAQRIRAAGYRTEIVQVPMIRHMTVPRESLGRLFRSLRHGFYVGRGEAARVFLARGQVKAALRGLDRVIVTLLHLVAGAVCLGLWWGGTRWPGLIWLAFSLISFAAFAWRSRSLSRPCFYVLEWLVQGGCLLVGLLTRRRSVESYRWEGEELVPSAHGAWSLPRVLLAAPLPKPPFHGGVEKGVDLLLNGDLAGRTSLRLFNTFRTPDPSRSLLARLSFQAGMLRRFWKALKTSPVDLVHVKTSSGINFYQNSLYALLARWSGLPVLIQIHSGRFEVFYGGSPAPLRFWIRHTLNRAARVAVLSQSWMARVQTIAPKARLFVVPNGLGETELERLDGGREIRPIHAFFLGTGRDDLNKDKGLDDLLDVLPSLAHKHPRSCWVLAGLETPESTRSRLEKDGIRGNGGAHNVQCLGLLDTEQKAELLRSSAVLVLPSYYENMPNVVLEGMAAGTGFVATDVGAIPEMLGYGEGGLLVAPGDRPALFAALDRLLASPALVRAQGRRNRTTVTREYTMAVVQKRLEMAYRDAAGWLDAGRSPQSTTGDSAGPSSPLPVYSPRRPVAGA